MDTLKLLDMESDEWRDVKLEPGEHWRTKKAYRCSRCGCITNRFWMFSPSWRAPKLFCPGRTAKQKLHDLLQEKIENDAENMHPKTYIEELKKKIEEIRKQFRDVHPDVEVIGDDWEHKNTNPQIGASIYVGLAG